MRRVIQRIAALRQLMSQTWHCIPQQGHGSGDMWSSHGRAAGRRIIIIAAVGGRASVSARCSDIRLDPVALIGGNRAAAAKGSNGISASVQGSCRVGCGVNSGRILHS
jgi:hypothetical protein